MGVSDDPKIAATRGALGDVYADVTQKELYCRAECPPVGRLSLTIRSGAFSFDMERSRKADGTLLLCLQDTFLDNKASETVAMLGRLSPYWEAVWPKIYEAILQVRRDYGCTADITNQNCSLALAPPEPEMENWLCELQLEPWDGFYAAEFNTAGIVDAFAGF